MKDGFQMVARIPYPCTLPKFYAVASEVATMDFLRSSGLPVPEIYGYSPTEDNEAGTEYTFMAFVRGVKLSDVWYDLDESGMVYVLRQLVELEAKMMALSFPASGSLYYSRDLEHIGAPGIPLEDQRFSVGPDTRLPLWFGRRSQLDVNRGPHRTPEAALASPAFKELAYLEKFGQPLLPVQRMRREAYEYQEQSPLDHVENLHRYLSIAPSLVPRDPSLHHFCVRHPDLTTSNIIVSKSPGSDSGHWDVAGIIDWQHASILPLFLHAAIPYHIQNYGDPISEGMIPPSLPKNLAEMGENKQSRVREVHHRRLVHYHYVKTTEELNKRHYAALMAPMGVLRRRLFEQAGNPWEGETIQLKFPLTEAVENWGALSGGNAPCPIEFEADDIEETGKLQEKQEGADQAWEIVLQSIVGCGEEGWVQNEDYEQALERCRMLKEGALAQAVSEKERAEIEQHWPLDDMDEGKYM
ncbi:protein kinase subdomain-containing protein PKL/CAK/Fmp29 [Coprinopsis cinerea AmutBmut pab1-1]|nr:protein kinase subdomain-containing protein PKL/CAK/Fmp29 [Coprinopsis cinerea AmutBmut pab1-1]